MTEPTTFDHIVIVKGRQEMRTALGAKALGGGKGLVEIIAGQHDLHRIATKGAGAADGSAYLSAMSQTTAR